MDDGIENVGDEEETSLDDMELAYREALKSIDEAEQQVGSALMELADDVSDSPDTDDESAFASIGSELAEDLDGASDAEPSPETLKEGSRRVSPQAVMEAALFVGEDVSLTAKKLASLIGQYTDARLAVRLIDELNVRYEEENRPYSIQLHEGGFRLELKEAFSEISARTFGLGPKDVRLSPDVLETLAYVAYNQPVTREDLDQTSQANAVALVKKLVRLRLIDVEKVGRKKSDVAYRTSQRFLDLFELNDLDELPQADIFSFK